MSICRPVPLSTHLKKSMTLVQLDVRSICDCGFSYRALEEISRLDGNPVLSALFERLRTVYVEQ